MEASCRPSGCGDYPERGRECGARALGEEGTVAQGGARCEALEVAGEHGGGEWGNGGDGGQTTLPTKVMRHFRFKNSVT